MNKKKFAFVLASAMLAAVLCAATYLFISDVRAQLWDNSISTIMESTRQGANALRIQLQKDYDILRPLSKRFGAVSVSQLASYDTIDSGTSLYLADGTRVSASAEPDLFVVNALGDASGDEGMIDPHISSVTGKNVFDVYLRTQLADGTDCFIVKEYGVDETAAQFSLSFYDNTGFSYLVNQSGTVLIRPAHVNSNKTIQNLFDMLSQEKNDPAVVDQFRQALINAQTGWARFSYKDANTIFCYTPLMEENDWYLVSIIPEQVIQAQTNNILFKAMLLLALVLLSMTLLLAVYLYNSGKTHRTLENQAAFITHLYNSVPEGIALISLEEPFRFIQVNREGRRLLGYPEDTPNDFSQTGPIETMLHPDDKEQIKQKLREAAVGGGKQSIVNQIVKLDGSYFWTSGIVERIVDMNGTAILIATFHDITREKLAEEEEEREKLIERRSLISAISNAYPLILSLNLTRDELNVLYAAPTMRMPLLPERTCTGIFGAFEASIHPDFRQEYRSRLSPKHLLECLSSAKSEVYWEARGLFTDGMYHWLSLQILHVDNPFSEDCTAILLIRCIDEQKHDEEQNRQALQTALDAANAASQAKGQFLSNMSHDIRTPLNAIMGMTTIAEAHLDERDRIEDCLHKIELSSAHLLSLINDVLDMSKIESGKLSLREEPVHLTALFSNVVELVRPQARDGSLTMEANLIHMRDEQVIGDPLRIRQVMINIISNAIKYTLPGGEVRLMLSQVAPYQDGYGNYQFECTDTGIGMDEAFLQKLFLPFERSRDSTTSKIAGTGLGMAITKNILDMMGGSIYVTSKPGKGSAFTVTLHLKLQEHGAKPTEAPPRRLEDRPLLPPLQEEAAFSGKRLLLVEDNELNLEIAQELIGMTGVYIETACNGLEAVRKIEQNPPGYYALVFMDVQMPVMDGYEATRQLRQLARPDVKALPIIAMTANAFAEDMEAASRAGMNGHISKPIDLNAVHETLRQWLTDD